MGLSGVSNVCAQTELHVRVVRVATKHWPTLFLFQGLPLVLILAYFVRIAVDFGWSRGQKGHFHLFHSEFCTITLWCKRIPPPSEFVQSLPTSPRKKGTGLPLRVRSKFPPMRQRKACVHHQKMHRTGEGASVCSSVGRWLHPAKH